MTMDSQNEISRLEQKIAHAWAEANAWKGTHTEHYRMGSALAESWEKQLAELLKNPLTDNDLTKP